MVVVVGTVVVVVVEVVVVLEVVGEAMDVVPGDPDVWLGRGSAVISEPLEQAATRTEASAKAINDDICRFNTPYFRYDMKETRKEMS